ncbi:MAG TPA: gamma-glutamyltransferase, partial [Fimbriimonas sp.]|nr:gamma-glutamyltransferase [Fimbriimonas sp.]
MFAALLLPLVVAQAGHPQPVVGSAGMVVCDEPLAAQVGVEILRKGGNAVDAAVALAFALAVVEPTAGNIGGGGFMLVRMADGRSEFIDYRETAPAAGHRLMYAQKPAESREGIRAGAVPGTVAGMGEAMRRFGKLPWKDVLDPAVRLAGGFQISGSQARALQRGAKRLSVYAETNRVWLRNGKPFEPGD